MLFALGAGVATFFYAQTQKSEAPAPIPTTQIVVAARDIPPKTQITPGDIKLVKMNSEAVPASAVSDSAQVVGRITLVGITTGEPILPTRLSGPNGAAFVVIPAEALGANGAPNPGSPNYRAMSITVADAQAAGGAILPGDIVDVLYTLNFSPEKLLVNPQPQRNSTDVTARIVLERVPILARTLSVYVIRTDAATAERIGYLTASGGSIQFLLRGPKDDRATGTTGATFRTVQPEVKIQIPEKITP